MKNIKISTRIYGLVVLLIAALIGTSGFSILKMQAIGVEIEDIAERDMPLTEKFTSVTLHQLEQAILFERSMSLSQRLSGDRANLAHFKVLEEEFSTLGHLVEDELKQAEAVLTNAIETAHTDKDKTEFRTLLAIMEKVHTEHKIYEELAEKTLHLAERGELQQALELAEEVEHQEKQIDKELVDALLDIEHFTEAALMTAEADERAAISVLLIAGSITVLLSAIAGFLITRTMTTRISEMNNAMEELANGAIDIEIPSLGLSNEIGQMASSLDIFKQNAIVKLRLEEEEREVARRREQRALDERQREQDQLESERKRDAETAARRQAREEKLNGMTVGFSETVEGILGIVAASSTQMESSAQSMSEVARKTEEESETVASAAEEATVSVQSVASATEELTSSINEISRQVSHSTNISGKAVETADGTSQTIRELAEAAQKIGDVVNLINDIAGQTNLLALNATIEAARAGDAGKGFAVVASEVKNLASQTAKATEDISAQIGSIQGATQNAVSSVEGIRKTIAEMNEIATMIASAVEEQGAATSEISRNIQEAATGTQSVSDSIVNVRAGSEQTGTASSEVLEASKTLSERFNILRQEVEQFVGSVKAI